MLLWAGCGQSVAICILPCGITPMASGQSPSLVVGHMSTHVSVPCLSGPSLPSTIRTTGRSKTTCGAEVYSGGSGVPDQLELHIEFKASLDYKGVSLS